MPEMIYFIIKGQHLPLDFIFVGTFYKVCSFIYIYIYICTIIIVVNRIQNKFVCIMCIYIYYVYINTHTYSIYFENIYISIFI